MKKSLIICILIVSVIFISGCTSEEKTNSETLTLSETQISSENNQESNTQTPESSSSNSQQEETEAESSLATKDSDLTLTQTIGPEKLPEYGEMINTYSMVGFTTTFAFKKSDINGFASTNSKRSKLSTNIVNPIPDMKKFVIIIQLLDNDGNVVFYNEDPITGEKFSHIQWYPDEYGIYGTESAIKSTDNLSKAIYWRILIYE